MIRSLVLFAHITGVVTMFAGLALEAFGVESSGKATPRIFGLAAPLTLLSGFYLGARFGILGNDWMRASYGGIVLMVVAGTLARRSDALRRISVRVQAAFGLAVVFLMVAKPDAVMSLVVLGLALGVSTLVALPFGLKQPNALSSRPGTQLRPAITPPSTFQMAPVTHPARSESRNSITSATSST